MTSAVVSLSPAILSTLVSCLTQLVKRAHLSSSSRRRRRAGRGWRECTCSPPSTRSYALTFPRHDSYITSITVAAAVCFVPGQEAVCSSHTVQVSSSLVYQASPSLARESLRAEARQMRKKSGRCHWFLSVLTGRSYGFEICASHLLRCPFQWYPFWPILAKTHGL